MLLGAATARQALGGTGSPEYQVLRKLAWYRLGGDLAAAARKLSWDELLQRAQAAARALEA